MVKIETASNLHTKPVNPTRGLMLGLVPLLESAGSVIRSSDDLGYVVPSVDRLEHIQRRFILSEEEDGFKHMLFGELTTKRSRNEQVSSFGGGHSVTSYLNIHNLFSKDPEVSSEYYRLLGHVILDHQDLIVSPSTGLTSPYSTLIKEVIGVKGNPRIVLNNLQKSQFPKALSPYDIAVGIADLAETAISKNPNLKISDQRFKRKATLYSTVHKKYITMMVLVI